MGRHVLCGFYRMDGLLGGRLTPSRLLLASIVLFGLHQGAIASGWSHPWADSYLDTLLFLPIAMGLPAWLIRFWQPAFRWRPPFVLGAWVAASVAFEAWIPSFDPRFTGDAWDVLSYALGAWLFQRTEARAGGLV
jgi:vacuolar-type H+-ATPase subunit I/STV1